MRWKPGRALAVGGWSMVSTSSFGQAAAVVDDVFKLGEEAAQRRAVVFHRFADVGDVGFGI